MKCGQTRAGLCRAISSARRGGSRRADEAGREIGAYRLESAGEIEIVAEAGTGEEAVEQARRAFGLVRIDSIEPM